MTGRHTHSLLEPGHRLCRLNLVLEADLGLASASAGDSVSWSAHDDVEVHSENTDTWVVLQSQNRKYVKIGYNPLRE